MLRESEEKKEVEAQEGHERAEDVTTQEKCVEAKNEANSMHEQSDVSNRHMTWWKKRMVDPCGQRTTLADGARPSMTWRAARRAAGQARDDDRVEETRSPAEEAEGET